MVGRAAEARHRLVRDLKEAGIDIVRGHRRCAVGGREIVGVGEADIVEIEAGHEFVDHAEDMAAEGRIPAVADLPIELPEGKRDHYPADPAALNALMAEHGLQAACSRLVDALDERLATG